MKDFKLEFFFEHLGPPTLVNPNVQKGKGSKSAPDSLFDKTKEVTATTDIAIETLLKQGGSDVSTPQQQ